MKSEKNPSFPWLDNLLSYFLNLKEIDDEIELIRVSLCEISQFSPISLFNNLDIDSKSFLTLNDFKSFLRSQKTNYDEQKLRKMIHNFDKDNDFSINLNEFIGLILPRKNEVLKKNILSIVNSYHKKESKVTEEMKSNLNDLILREMKLIKELGEISSKIKNSKIFSTYEAFMVIVGDENYMTKTNLYRFLKKNGAYINDNEVTQLMFRLDADNDDRISYEEFKEIFYPLKEDFVYAHKNDLYNSDNEYETNKKYNYISKDRDYNNNNNNDNEYKNEYNKDDYEYKEGSNKDDDYNNIDNDDNKANEVQEKKGKKTKKVILKPGKNTNLLRSQEPKNKEFMNNPQEESYSKFPNINNNNSTDNYTLKNKTKYNNYSFSKNYKNKSPSFNENENDDNDDDNGNKYNSKITQESLIINNNNNPSNKYKYTSRKYKYTSSKNYSNYDNEDNKYPDNDNNEINNYENNTNLRSRNKKFFSPDNDKNNNYNHNHETVNCKGCLYSAKNILNNYKTKKYNNFSNTIDNNYNNDDDENDNDYGRNKRNDYKYKNNKRNDINRNLPTNDYSKMKEELLRKYGNGNNYKNNRDNYFFSSEENYCSSINRCFSSPKKDLLENNENDNENDNWNNNKYDYNNKNEEEIKPPKTYTSKRITENRYITNSRSNYFSPSSINNDNNKKKNIFAERFNRIKENKENKVCKNCAPSPRLRDIKRNNIKENNINDKKDLLYKLFLDFIEQDNKLENIKESLSKCQDASLQKIFELFNINKKNIICSSDIYEVLNSLSKNNNFNSNEIKYIFKKYNKSIEAGFNYDEFSNIILPRNISAKLRLENKKSDLNEELENDTTDEILELFETLIEGEKSSEEIRSKISMAADNIFYDLFGEIKKENKPGIQKDDIDKFMKRNGYDIKDYEIEIIMEKMDKNKDGIIDYEEFISEVQSKIF